MGEESPAETAVALPPFFFHHRRSTVSSSSTFTYLSFRQPEFESSVELHESDVVWSSSSSPADDFAAAVDEENADDERFFSGDSVLSLQRGSFSPTAHLRRLHLPESNGLSALLIEDRLPKVLQQPKTAAAPLMVPGRRAEEANGGEFHGQHHRYQSAPMNIPAWPQWKKAQKNEILEEGEWWEEREEEEEEEMVPPHMIVARSHMTTFSVFEGVGRTLKGRDLRRVRNAVLQKTGFLDL